MEKNININVTANTSGVKSLRSELRETIQELQKAEIGTAEFDRLNAKAAQLKDRMAEVNEQVAVFATGSKYEQVSNSLGEIGAGLRDMDFDRVTNGAKLFQKTAASITRRMPKRSARALNTRCTTERCISRKTKLAAGMRMILPGQKCFPGGRCFTRRVQPLWAIPRLMRSIKMARRKSITSICSSTRPTSCLDRR